MGLNNLRIWMKMALGFGVVVMIFGAFSFYQISSLNHLGELQHEGVERAKDAVVIGGVDSRLEQLYGLVSAAIAERDADRGRQDFRSFRPQALQDISTVRDFADTPEERAAAESFSRDYMDYLALFETEVLPALSAGNTDPAVLEGFARRVDALRSNSMESLDFVLEALKDEMISSDREFDAIHEEILTTTLAACGMGLGAAVLMALLTSLSIVRPLRRVVDYAQDIARGDFGSELAVHQKDEIGRLAEAVRTIPATLSAMHVECARVVRTVRSGRLRERGDVSEFDGGYADIISGANLLADTYTGYLDAVPSPVMAVDTELNVLFLNKAGGDVAGLGEGRKPGQCRDLFCTSDCGTDKCACARAMRSGQVERSETDAHPQGLDLAISYSATPIRDENGGIVGALEIVSDQTAVVRAKQKMEAVAARAESISMRVSTATDQLAAQVEQVSRGSEVQRMRMTETATAMEQMNSTVTEVARNATAASANSNDAREKALHGAQVVGRAVQAISLVHASAEELQQNMRELGTEAESIGQVMDVIGDIADQTNLLALNAAIEAARAGEAGRGFAVVADEVRKLAEKSMAATQDVEAKIRAIQNSAKTNIDGVGKASRAVDEATELAEESGRALAEIVELVEDNARQVDGIATASEEQSAASEQITGAVEEVHRIVGETNEGMQESSKALQELAVMSSELKSVIGQLADADGNVGKEPAVRSSDEPAALEGAKRNTEAGGRVNSGTALRRAA